MKDILLIEKKSKLTYSNIELLEDKLLIHLPLEYKNFLLNHNGGHPNKDVYPLIDTKLCDGADIAWFYAFYDGDFNNLMKEHARYEDRMSWPPKFGPPIKV